MNYAVTINFHFDASIPCDDLSAVKETFQNDTVNSLVCVAENGTCSTTLEITGCSDARKKRNTDGSAVEITLMIPLQSDVPFDLVEYYATSVSKNYLNISFKISEI